MVDFGSHFAGVSAAKDRSRWAGRLGAALSFETAIIAFGIGIATYFAWPTEPNVIVSLLSVGIVTIFASRLSYPWAGIVAIFAVLLFGFAWSTAHTQLMSPNPVAFEQRMTVNGWVLRVETGGRMRRLSIEVASVDPIPKTGVPSKVRIRVGRNFSDLQVGEGIRVDAVIGPMPGPAVPHGYDPGRRAFFDGLAGTGFAISDAQSFEPDLSRLDKVKANVALTRHRIADRVLKASPEATAGLQAALLTGIRDNIPDEQTDNLRASGLAHILAISGLHMGMVAFGVYVVASMLLAAIQRLSRGRDVRKIAAMIGILAATVYLLLSGASVATQRAYIMVTIVFLAVILDRRVLSLRSVAVAALLTLIIRPEALLSVGFQMSFSAVAAMVVIFRAWQDYRPRRRNQGLRDRITSFYGSLFGTSLIAGFATGGFALLHFGRIAQYGLLANMAAMTVFPVVMALGILSLIVMPVGAEALPLLVMSKAISFMLVVADWVSGLPGAVGTVKASQPWVIALYGFGFACACFGTLRSAAVGILTMLTAFAFWALSPTYDLRINEDGRVSLLTDSGGVTTSLRADRYGRDQFARASGLPAVEWTDYRDVLAQCDVLACRFTVMGSTISVIEEPSEVPEACTDSDLVILPSRRAGPVAKRACEALLIDSESLRQSGGLHLRLGEPIRLTPISSDIRGKRPWGRGT